MGSIRRMVNDIVSGRRTLDIETARDIIDNATGDKRIEESDELAPLRDLFESGQIRSDVSATKGGAAFIQGFLKHAQAQHDDIGESKSSRTRELKPMAARFATNTLLSKDALADYTALYKGTQPGETFRRPPEPGETTFVTVTPKWVEEMRNSLVKYVETHMAGSFWERMWQAMGESSNVDWKANYNAPVETYKRWLAGRSVRRSPTGSAPLDSQLREFERNKIRNAMDTAGGDREVAAGILGLSRSALERKLAEHGLS
jgi:DNA-binding protein Fis